MLPASQDTRSAGLSRGVLVHSQVLVVCRGLSSAFFYGGYQCSAGSTPSPLGAG